jgi:hypothetical protein
VRDKIAMQLGPKVGRDPTVGGELNRIHQSLDRAGAFYGIAAEMTLQRGNFIQRGIRPPGKAPPRIARDREAPVLIVSPRPSASPNHRQRSLGVEAYRTK